MKRIWTNWFRSDAPRKPTRPRRRLGSGFEAIEPRLLMARDAGQIAPIEDPSPAPSLFIDIGDNTQDGVDYGPIFLSTTRGRGDSAATGKVAETPINVGPVQNTRPVQVVDPDAKTPPDHDGGPDQSGFIITELPPNLTEPAEPPSEPAPTAPETSDSGTATEFYVPGDPPDRVQPPLPESPNQPGGVIDIAPRDVLEREEQLDHEEVVSDSVPNRKTRMVAPRAERSDQESSDALAATQPLRAARGEAQAFELASMHWRKDRLASQRIAPPKPDELVLPARQLGGDEAPIAEQAPMTPVEVPEPRRRENAEVATLATEPVETTLMALQAALGRIAGSQALARSSQQDAAPSNSSAGVEQSWLDWSGGSEIVVAALVDTTEQPMRLADRDTATRMVGFGIMVAACHASGIHVPAERPAVPRSAARDWELKPGQPNR